MDGVALEELVRRGHAEQLVAGTPGAHAGTFAPTMHNRARGDWEVCRRRCGFRVPHAFYVCSPSSSFKQASERLTSASPWRTPSAPSQRGCPSGCPAP